MSLQLLFPVYLVCTHYNIHTALLKCSEGDSGVKIPECERDSCSLFSASVNRMIISSGPVLCMSILVYRERIHDVLLWDEVKLASI